MVLNLENLWVRWQEIICLVNTEIYLKNEILDKLIKKVVLQKKKNCEAKCFLTKLIWNESIMASVWVI